MRSAVVSCAVIVVVAGIMVPSSPRVLELKAQERVLGGQEFEDKECHDTTATCDILEFGIVCGVSIGEGEPCFNCNASDTRTDMFCVNSQGDTCDVDLDFECGLETIGRCEGAYCKGTGPTNDPCESECDSVTMNSHK